MIYKKINIYILLLILFVFIKSIYANEKKYVVSFAIGEYSPYISENLQGYGPTTQIITEACKRSGIKPKYFFMPWNRVLYTLSKGKYFASFFWSRTKERKKNFIFSDCIINEGLTGIFYKKSKFPEGIKFNDWSDLAGYKIVGVSAYYYEEEFKKHKISVYYRPTSELAWKIFIRNGAEVYVDSLYVGLNDAKKFMPDIKDLGYTAKQKKDSYNDVFIIYSKVHKDTIWVKNKLDNAVKSMYKDGTYKKIINTMLKK